MSAIVKKILLSIPSAAIGLIFREVFQAWGIFDPFSQWLGGWLKMHITPAQVEWTIAGILALVAYAALYRIVLRHNTPLSANVTLPTDVHRQSSPQRIGSSRYVPLYEAAQRVLMANNRHAACVRRLEENRPDDIITWYCYHLHRRLDIYGCHSPSTTMEIFPRNGYGFKIENKAVLCGRPRLASAFLTVRTIWTAFGHMSGLSGRPYDRWP